MLGKTLVNIGLWLNKHFPEKMSTDEVYAILERLSPLAGRIDELERSYASLSAKVSNLEKKAETLTSENTALKAASAMRMRSSIPMPGR